MSSQRVPVNCNPYNVKMAESVLTAPFHPASVSKVGLVSIVQRRLQLQDLVSMY